MAFTSEIEVEMEQTFTIVLEETIVHPVYTWRCSSYDRNFVILEGIDSVVIQGTPTLEKHFTFRAVQPGETEIKFSFDSIYPDPDTGEVTPLRGEVHHIIIGA
jgi:hypothetical protein